MKKRKNKSRRYIRKIDPRLRRTPYLASPQFVPDLTSASTFSVDELRSALQSGKKLVITIFLQ